MATLEHRFDPEPSTEAVAMSVSPGGGVMALWRVRADGEERLAVGPAEQGPDGLLPAGWSLDELLNGSGPFTSYQRAEIVPIVGEAEVLVPLGGQEVWAGGVTFEESRYARELESGKDDLYRDVYFADRPELFLKAPPGTTMGPGDAIGVRRDSSWDVPEPELGLVIDAKGSIVAFTIGNDVSSRSIEGANPLYLPQAKIYDGSCAVGPCLVPLEEAPPVAEVTVSMQIHRNGSLVFGGQSDLTRMRRSPTELVSWLYRARSFPIGTVLLTGTGTVPPETFTLHHGDVVTIVVPGVGRLINHAALVGRTEDGNGG